MHAITLLLAAVLAAWAEPPEETLRWKYVETCGIPERLLEKSLPPEINCALIPTAEDRFDQFTDEDLAKMRARTYRDRGSRRCLILAYILKILDNIEEPLTVSHTARKGPKNHGTASFQATTRYGELVDVFTFDDSDPDELVDGLAFRMGDGLVYLRAIPIKWERFRYSFDRSSVSPDLTPQSVDGIGLNRSRCRY